MISMTINRQDHPQYLSDSRNLSRILIPQTARLPIKPFITINQSDPLGQYPAFSDD